MWLKFRWSREYKEVSDRVVGGFFNLNERGEPTVKEKNHVDNNHGNRTY